MGISEHDLGRDVDVRGVEVVDECRSYVIRVRYVRGLSEGCVCNAMHGRVLWKVWIKTDINV
jgi:hypothetical protein